jgi:exonuclease SbcD
MLHLADIHIGMENYGRTDPATGLNTRLLDYLARLDQVLDHALIEEPVDLVLIAGDIYKNRTPNPTHQREFARRIKRVLQANIPVVILTGNHDMPAASGRAHSVEIFDALAVDGVTIASRMRTYMIDTRNGPVQIVAVPWLNRQALLTKDDLQGLPMTAVDAEMLHRVESWLEHAVTTLDPAIPTVLTFHGTIAGATFGSERAVMLGHDLILPRSVIAQPGIDYVALGHIHKHQVIGNDPPAVYPGSLERVDFGEEHETKGFVVVDLQKGATTWRFVDVAARPFVTVEVDVRQAPDPQERIRRAIAKQRLTDAIVRVMVKCLPQQRPQIDERLIREQIEEAGAATIAMVGLDVERVARGRFDAVAEQLQGGLTPRRALELYLQTKEVAPARQERLLAATDELLREE